MDLQAARKKYLQARREYYKGTPVMSDCAFDKLEAFLAKVAPNRKPLHATGARVGKKVEVRLPAYMPSLRKVHCGDEKTLAAWTKLYGTSAYVMPKIDGSSVVVVYNRGKLQQIITRGDGVSGKDITHLHAGLPQLPAAVGTKSPLYLRCEVVIPTDVYDKKWSTQFRNPRNMVAGVLNRQDLHDALKDFHFVVLKDLASSADLRLIEYAALPSTMWTAWLFTLLAQIFERVKIDPSSRSRGNAMLQIKQF